MDIFRTYLFLIPLIVLLLSEVAKVLITRMKKGHWEERLFRPGGMPSSHSAFVTSLLIVVGRKTGIESVAFTIAFVFAAIVWYDAMSARRELGEQAEILNRLQHWKHLPERLGHSFVEVLGGILFGVVVTGLGIWVS